MNKKILLPADLQFQSDRDTRIVEVGKTHPVLMNTSGIVAVYHVYEKECFVKVFCHHVVHLWTFTNSRTINNN
jgi:hypothetical protein